MWKGGGMLQGRGQTAGLESGLSPNPTAARGLKPAAAACQWCQPGESPPRGGCSHYCSCSRFMSRTIPSMHNGLANANPAPSQRGGGVVGRTDRDSSARRSCSAGRSGRATSARGIRARPTPLPAPATAGAASEAPGGRRWWWTEGKPRLTTMAAAGGGDEISASV